MLETVRGCSHEDETLIIDESRNDDRYVLGHGAQFNVTIPSGMPRIPFTPLLAHEKQSQPRGAAARLQRNIPGFLSGG